MEMRELIDLIEFKQMEAEFLNEKMGPLAKGMATLGAIGSMATGALADEPANMDPGADANDAQAVQTMPSKYPGAYDHQMAQNDANAKLPDTNIKFYPTTKHFEVAQKVTSKEFAEYQVEVKKLSDLRIKAQEWSKQSAKNRIADRGIFGGPYSKDIAKQIDITKQASYDFLATYKLLMNPRIMDKYADNIGGLKGVVSPGSGADAAVENFQLYLKNVQSFEAPGSAGRNVPQ